mmetsp:Transcript_58514/g.88248  ORF Transcript_58514/g.88248 Transcript_58514/m.88248 type:complete len:334 (+) Transcript_58514:70-1071(+)
MQLADILNSDKPHSAFAASGDQPRQQNAFHFQHCEQAQERLKVKLVSQDTFEQMQVEALKDQRSVDEVLSLLSNLRDGLQISDSVHESLSEAFKLLSKGKEEATASCSGKADGVQSPSERCDAEMEDEAMLTATGGKIPKRKSASRPFKPPRSKRQQLTSEEAAEIYAMRPELAKEPFSRRGCLVNSMAKSKLVAPHFGVTAKTVRDIWHGRTWVTATRHLWTEREVSFRAKRAVESDGEEKHDSSASASPTNTMDNNLLLHNFAQNLITSYQLSSLLALSSLKRQAMMGSMSGLPLQLPFPSSAPPSAPRSRLSKFAAKAHRTQTTQAQVVQ